MLADHNSNDRVYCEDLEDGHDKRNPMRVHVANDFTMKKRSLPLRVMVIQAATCLTIFSLFSFENWSTLSSFDSLCAKLRLFSLFMMRMTIMRSATMKFMSTKITENVELVVYVHVNTVRACMNKNLQGKKLN